MDRIVIWTLPLLLGWILDRIFGDPEGLPHPVVEYGKAIAALEKRYNNGPDRVTKGALTAIVLIIAAFMAGELLMVASGASAILQVAVATVIVFYCLAGCTLIKEVREVFRAVAVSVEAGRRQVARIVGRDTSQLDAQEIRTAALETLAENLSDGVVAPLFWYVLAGPAGMLAYKMVNTLDSMIGYKTERYRDFGRIAARIDDVANFVPARLTALFILLAAGRLDLWRFVRHYGPQHASPNSGWPEAAMAGVLGCRFGGTHTYFGQVVEKPYIGDSPRELTDADCRKAISVAVNAEAISVIAAAAAVMLLARI